MWVRLLACAVASPCVSIAAPTTNCSDQPWYNGIVLNGIDPAAIPRIERAAADPSSDRVMSNLIGDVRRTHPFTLSFGGPPISYLELTYDGADDVFEIAARLRTAPALLGTADLSESGAVACFAVPYAGTPVTVTEYHNAILDHYFLSSTAEENAIIDSGGAGPGWSRTGESWTTYTTNLCASPHTSKSVYRFYGTPNIGPNSHFFTAGPQECGTLRNGRGWTYEGIAFGAELPSGGVCPANARVPVYRAYNMRWLQNDSNHRHTANLATYQQMQARGWYGEGIAFCVSRVN